MLNYGIPSYKRPQCDTISTLLKLGVEKDRIAVSLQEDDKAYKKIHPDIHFFLRNADCAAGNRNTLIKNMDMPLVLLDDDITGFAIRKNGINFKRITDIAEFEAEIESAIAEAKENKVSLIGASANANNLVARGRDKYSFDCLLQGSFLVMLSPVLFDEEWKMVEDYELSLRLLKKRHTMRMNQITAFKPKNGTNDGGLHARYASGQLPSWTAKLAQKYPYFKPNKTLTGGQVRF